VTWRYDGRQPPLRVFTLLHGPRPALVNPGEPGGIDVTPWADRIQMVDATYVGRWELPVLGEVTAPTAVADSSDGYVGLRPRDGGRHTRRAAAAVSLLQALIGTATCSPSSTEP
jgi:hypothetical protein